MLSYTAFYGRDGCLNFLNKKQHAAFMDFTDMTEACFKKLREDLQKVEKNLK